MVEGGTSTRTSGSSIYVRFRNAAAERALGWDQLSGDL
jgi:hypothetical protein